MAPLICILVPMFLIVQFFFFVWLYKTGDIIVFQNTLDFASLLLTAAALLLAAAAAFMAIVAVWGYRDIKNAAAEEARKVAKKVAGVTATNIARREALDATEAVTTSAQEADTLVAALREQPDNA